MKFKLVRTSGGLNLDIEVDSLEDLQAIAVSHEERLIVTFEPEEPHTIEVYDDYRE